jgi:predicted RNA-binding protein with TRAM domain
MKTIFLLTFVIVILTACGSASNTPSPNTNANKNANSNSATSASSGEAGKAPTPSPSPSTAPLSEGKTVTVRFPTGATEASYTDSFSGYGYIDYVFDAKANQKMTAEITKADGNRAILSVMKDGGPVETDASQVQGWTGLLPENGHYTVRVGQMRNEARQDDKPVKFSLLISIVDE